MIIGNFRYSLDDDSYTGELRTLTMLRKNVVLRPLRKTKEREPDYRIVEITDDASVELGAAWRKRTERGREYLSVLLDDPTLSEPLNAALFLGDDDQRAELVWSRPAIRSQVQPEAAPPGKARVTARAGSPAEPGPR